MKYAQIAGNEVLQFTYSPTLDLTTTSNDYVVFDFPEGARPDDYYFDGTDVLIKPEVPYNITKTLMLADATDTVIIDGFPTGTEVKYMGKTHQADSVEFVTDTAGLYEFILSLDGYRDSNIRIEAVEAP